MQYDLAPAVVRAFLEGDKKTIRRLCEGAGAQQLLAVIEAREEQGIVFDPNVLHVEEVEVVTAAPAEMGDEGPTVVLKFNATQIKCDRDKQGAVIEGGPDQLRLTWYMIALMRQYNEATSELEWKVRELAVLGDFPTF